VIGPDGTVRVLDMSPELLEVALQLDPTNQRLLRYKAMLEAGRLAIRSGQTTATASLASPLKHVSRTCPRRP